MTATLSRRQMLAVAATPILLPPLRVSASEQAPKEAQAADLLRLFQGMVRSPDYRHGPLKTLNDEFPFSVPPDRESWEIRRRQLREQLLVALGLWPMPERSPLQPVIHGRIVRKGYTVEKVYFASWPGHYVCGNLYRPQPNGEGATGNEGEVRYPGVLFAHGHWANGRFHDAGEKAARASVASGGEPDLERARFFMQALPAILARLGFVVFHYDMVGYADSTAIAHTQGFRDAEAELRLQSFMGLQTWNSIRALDFLASLPDVDPQRLGMTGASGGGTQTFILAAIDDRLRAAFPAVMVSTSMQGGCVCENASHLRVGPGNVEIAALFAPKPMAFSAANDWTREFLKRGYPELQQLYALYAAEDKVQARAWLEYGHQFNVHARQMMYAWFLKHLQGREAKVEEPPFEPVPPKELSVFDTDHPRPRDERDAKSLREYLTQQSEKQRFQWLPSDPQRLRTFRRIVGTALRVMIHSQLPQQVVPRNVPGLELPRTVTIAGQAMQLHLIGREQERDALPVALCRPSKGEGNRCVVWLHPQGKASLVVDGQLHPALRQLLAAECTVLAPDLLGSGDNALPKPFQVNKDYAGYTYGYNRTFLAQQVHDALTAIAWCHQLQKGAVVHLVGWESCGLVALLAKAMAKEAVGRTAADLQQFSFHTITDVADSRMLPGAVKYGDVPAFAALCAPDPLLVYNHRGLTRDPWPENAYRTSHALHQLQRLAEPLSPQEVVRWLLQGS
ncbi:MAG: acetylxylan esterase [Gemmataceae bacterium]|nr:MAG: acetylxylan esterase [Gemmataceae bacterium]